MEWTEEGWAAAQASACRYGGECYRAGMVAHLKRGRARSTYRYDPDTTHRRMVELLGDRNGMEEFKYLNMMLRGYNTRW